MPESIPKKLALKVYDHLTQINGIPAGKAKAMVDFIDFLDFYNDYPREVGHYPPSYWADKLADYEHLFTECVCGRYGYFSRGDIDRNVRGKEIRIKNVPHYYCEHCEETWFDLESKVPTLMKRAYESEGNEFDYEQLRRSDGK